MHVLVVNDDGPPSQKSSPYIHSFIHELQQAGVTVSVVLPHVQRSWIGKAHFIERALVPTYFQPGTLHRDDGTTHARPRIDGGEEWVLINGTPASCTQIGLYHYFQEKGPIDLVVSGPNYGRNSTSLFSLSSGTLGGAMEGAVCGRRSIALSYAYSSRAHDPAIIRGASLVSVRLVKHLYENWASGVDLYSVNLPMVEGIGSPETKIVYTDIYHNRWPAGGSFGVAEDGESDELDPGEREVEIKGGAEPDHRRRDNVGLKHKKFVWAPNFGTMFSSVAQSPPGSDAWALNMGHVSVTPLKASYMHFDGLQGEEIKLGEGKGSIDSLYTRIELESSKSVPCYAIVGYEDGYVQPKIVEALEKRIPGIIVAQSPAQVPSSSGFRKVLHWSTYEAIDFESVLKEPESVICCSYMIRKALIRKHYLAHTVHQHVAKHPGSVLARAFAQTHDFELDYAEYLDEALAEAYELRDSLAGNEGKCGDERQWWILKPGMSDRGQGIRLFSTEGELASIFEGFEGDEDEDEDGDKYDTSIITNQLRHFVSQEYIHPPLLIDRRKFHIRTYVLSVGGLKVYVYKPMLALFAAKEYLPPWEESTDLAGHLTNTCLQSGDREGSVRLFWAMDKHVQGGKEALENMWRSLCEVVAETFRAAAVGQRIHFQALPNAFEIFGLDFMVDADMRVYLLEVNSYPDFKQSGEELSGLISGLFAAVADVAVRPFMGDVEGDSPELVKVLEVGLGAW